MDSNPGLLSSALIEFGRCGNYCCHSMTDAKQHAGFAPLETLPAEWYNNYNYLLDTHINQVQTILRQAQTEIANVLEAGGQAPDATSTCQLLPAIKYLIQEQRPLIATGSTAGLVTSSNASNAVSVNGTTGVMTPNALSDWEVATTVKQCIDSFVSGEGSVTNATCFGGCTYARAKADIRNYTPALATNATCFGGCTYAQAKADIRSGLTSCTGTVTSISVYCGTTLKQTITSSGSICLGSNAFNSTAFTTCTGTVTVSDKASANANTPIALCTGATAVGRSTGCALTFNTSTGVLTAIGFCGTATCATSAVCARQLEDNSSMIFSGTTANDQIGLFYGGANNASLPGTTGNMLQMQNSINATGRWGYQLFLNTGGCVQYRYWTNSTAVSSWIYLITSRDIGSQSVASATNATCFGGCTYAQAKADIRNYTPALATNATTASCVNANGIIDATNRTVDENAVIRKSLITTQIRGHGFISRVAIGQMRSTTGWGTALLSVGCSDDGASWVDYKFNVDGYITAPTGYCTSCGLAVYATNAYPILLTNGNYRARITNTASVELGLAACACACNSIVIGDSGIASGAESIALGTRALVYSDTGIAIGCGAQVADNNPSGIAIGYRASSYSRSRFSNVPEVRLSQIGNLAEITWPDGTAACVIYAMFNDILKTSAGCKHTADVSIFGHIKCADSNRAPAYINMKCWINDSCIFIFNEQDNHVASYGATDTCTCCAGLLYIPKINSWFYT